MEWRLRAGCRDEDPEPFFADHGSDAEREALMVCSWCPVRSECLHDALAAEDGRSPSLRYGIFGGATPYERAVLDGTVEPKPARPIRPARVPKPKVAAREPGRCRRGHDLADAIQLGEGRRRCRACKRDSDRRRNARRTAAPCAKGTRRGRGDLITQ